MAGEVADLVADAELASVFGIKNLKQKVLYSGEGQQQEVTLGKMLKLLGGRFLSRVYHPLRNIFDIFDYMNVSFEEKENAGNVERFKVVVRKFINERREELKDP
jgi:hypothetical protein